MTRCTFAHVDLAALQANFRAISEFLSQQTRPGQKTPGIIAVVKANAYGHGAPAAAVAPRVAINASSLAESGPRSSQTTATASNAKATSSSDKPS